jgi:pyruvate/2-oxoglutarate dehydrogenase complex dihydrolipoamide dehydrogenase (E3) component
MANLKELPHSLAVFGGGVIGVEYATILAEVGVQTSILCKVSHVAFTSLSITHSYAMEATLSYMQGKLRVWHSVWG